MSVPSSARGAANGPFARRFDNLLVLRRWDRCFCHIIYRGLSALRACGRLFA
jgi:hypothetical protein